MTAFFRKLRNKKRYYKTHDSFNIKTKGSQKIRGYLRYDYKQKSLFYKKMIENESRNNFFSKKFDPFEKIFENNPNRIKYIPNSFSKLNRFLFFKKRVRRYKKLSSLHYADIFKPLESWGEAIFKQKVSKPILSYIKHLKFIDTAKDLFYLNRSKEGKKIRNFIEIGRIRPESIFFFLKRNFYRQIKKYKGHFTQTNSLGANKRLMFLKLKQNYGFGYKYIKRRTQYAVSPGNKLWHRTIIQDLRKFLGTRTIGEYNKYRYLVRYFSGKNTSGFDFKIASKIGMSLANVVYTLKIAPNKFLAIQLVRQGYIFVDGKIEANPLYEVKVSSLITFKRKLFDSFLFSLLSKEDSFFYKKESRNYQKHSINYLARYRVPSYLEVSYKLNEVLILGNTLFREQPNPLLFQKTNIPEHLKAINYTRGNKLN